VFCELLLKKGLPPDHLYSLDADPYNFERDVYPRVHTIVASAAKLPFPRNTFDVVYSSELTPDNPRLPFRTVLREIARVLKPKGFYCARESFDAILQLKLTNQERKRQLELLQIIQDTSFLASIGFLPVQRIPYARQPKGKPGHQVLYVLGKKQ